ncbi:MAG: hypothetical protein KKD65_13100 [Gammaproteobacteria bacterium]|nr:hypothetical protein [Gammaproteobacteria bacterium]
MNEESYPPNHTKENGSPSQKLLQDTYSKIGRNLMLYQQIEIGLKSLLPFIHPDGGAKGIEDFRKFKLDISEKTLGQIFGEFKKSITVRTEEKSEEDSLEKYLRKINDERNNLVHGLLKLPGMSLDSESGCKNIISYLDGNLEDINNVQVLLQPIVQQIAADWKHAELDESGNLKRAINFSMSFAIKFE